MIPPCRTNFLTRRWRHVSPKFPPRNCSPAWTAASQVLPEITRFIWEPNDYQWLPEACTSHPSYKGFYTVADFMRGNGMPESGDLNIRQWRDRLLKNQPMDGLTPLQVAARLRDEAQTALRGLDALRPRAGKNKELRQTLGDIEAQARLGQYYAAKIEGAAELALFDATTESDAPGGGGEATRKRAQLLARLCHGLHESIQTTAPL